MDTTRHALHDALPSAAHRGWWLAMHVATRALGAVCLLWMGACTTPVDTTSGADAGEADDAGYAGTANEDGRPPRDDAAGGAHGQLPAVSATRTVVAAGAAVPTPASAHDPMTEVSESAPEATPREAAEVTGAGADAHASLARPALPTGWSERHALVASGGGVHLLLGIAEGEDLAHGPPRLADRRGHVVHASIPDADLPAEARAWRGRRVQVVTDRGARCPARVGAFEYRVDLLADDAELVWDGRSPDSIQELRRLRGSDLAQAVWNASDDRMITARLRLDDPRACEGEPVFAHDASQPPGRVATELTSVPRRKAVMQAYRALPAYRRAQAEYAAMVKSYGPDAVGYPARWDEDDRRPAVQAFAFEADQDVLVSVSVPWAACAYPDWALWAVFRVRRNGNLPPELVHASTAIAPIAVRFVLDAGDGSFDYGVDDDPIGGGSVVRGDRVLSSWSREFHGCGC